MLFAIARKDKVGMTEKRVELLAAHAEYQKGFMGRITFGGGLVADGTDVGNFVYGPEGIRNVTGNILILDVPDREPAESFHANDPYTLGGIFETVIIEPFLQRVPPLKPE